MYLPPTCSKSALFLSVVLMGCHSSYVKESALFETLSVPKEPNYLAPDGSEIRLLPRMGRGSLAYCILPRNKVSKAIYHQTVDEIWFFTIR